MKLITSDKEVFEIDAKIASLSELLLDFLNEDGDDNNDEPIPLAEVTSDVMKKVIEWAEYHKDDPIQDKEEEGRRTPICDISSWDASFLKVDQGMLFSLIAAANYLKIDGLLDLGCKTVANMIKGKTPAQIRMIFNMRTAPLFVQCLDKTPVLL